MVTELNFDSLLPSVRNRQVAGKNDFISEKTFVGIDFGTSTTVVSIAYIDKLDGNLKTRSLELQQMLDDGSTYISYKVPSVIAYYKNTVLAGEGARKIKHKLRQGKNLWHSFKMQLGEDVGCMYPESELGKGHPVISLLNPVDVTSLFFNYLRSQIDKIIERENLSKKIELAVSIPASFEANQRKDLLTAIEKNGFTVSKQSLIDEPNAAFLSFVLNPGENKTSIKIPEDYFPNVLVFDFGAGTCDISILELGLDKDGVYSKNIAISKFEKLGGDDIDRLLAIDILLPQLLAESNFKIKDFRNREIYDLIIPKLLPAAERLKILICEKVSLMRTTMSVEQISQSRDFIKIGTPVSITTSKGELTLSEPKMNIKGFADVMSLFTDENLFNAISRIDNEYKFSKIFAPVESALKKANLTGDKIDYVLLIGGSAKNPFIQNALSQYFPESELLIPADLQAQVSNGAALHSLIYNGFGKNVIQPITSEPIMLISVKDGREVVEPIIAAGTVIPSDIVTVNNLAPQRQGQQVIEMPICVGGKNKILYNILIHSDNDSGFNLNDKIRLDFEINADKMLICRASAGEKRIMVEPLSPFSNRELTSEERIKLKAEKEFNIACTENGGYPTLQSLEKLHTTYDNLELNLQAAETLELINELFPGKANLNNIGVHYSKAGKKDKAVDFYRKSLSETPSATTALNLALAYQYTDRSVFEEFLEKAYQLNPTDNVTLYLKGRSLIENGKAEEGCIFQQKAYDSWKKMFDNDTMDKWDYSWFASCATALGKYDMARIIKAAEPNQKYDNLYSADNLTQFYNANDIVKK